ncbi:MAG TPA: cytochrome b/b6 domain-containing protein [Verrucomicrobiae bacterium]|nr:cytochrome b/b6 domain-containing protein [Verrucomicrobiae bacterium]
MDTSKTFAVATVTGCRAVIAWQWVLGAKWSCLMACLWLAGFSASAQEKFSNADCLDCHLDPSTTRMVNGKTVSLLFPTNAFQKSVHAKLACVDCHVGIKELVHGHPLPSPDCDRCHEKEAKAYVASIHGISRAAGAPDAANCWDCHGSHAMLPDMSPGSPLNFFQQAKTCGACHEPEAGDWSQSVHGQAAMAGKRDAPTCTDCHPAHTIDATKNDSALEIAETCSRCHASVTLDSRYNLPADRVKTYFESYHGLAAQYGSTVVANCASCHSYHKVLPSSDPNSTINTNHLVATCGQCHPGANRMFVSGKIHQDISVAAAGGGDAGVQISRWVRQIYLLLIFGVVGAMFVHNALLFYKKVAAHLRASGRPVLRMSLSQRWQHAVLALSFITLAVTGFALKFPDSGLARMLGSSEPFRRWIHRIAGIVLLLAGAYHVIHVLATREGRRLLRDIFPVKKDLADVRTAVRYLAGLSDEKPTIGRFGYAEKMEYWAVVWGTIIMGMTGLMIWFKLDVTRFLPRWAVDVALTIHYYEAVLACLAIVVWHFYHVIFDPDIYPLNTACWSGRVSEEWQKHEHPLEEQVVPLPAADLNPVRVGPVEKAANQPPTISAGMPDAPE